MAGARYGTVSVDTAGQRWRLLPLADIHWGAPGSSIKRFRQDVQMIKDNPGHYWLGLGDYIDCITHNDRKRFNPKHFQGTNYAISDLANLPKIQTEEFLHEVWPIKDKCLALWEGNHEWNNPRYNAYDPMSEILQALGVPFIGVSGYLLIRVSDRVKKGKTRYTFTIWAHHGYGAGRTHGGNANALQQEINMVQDAQLYLMGHRHDHIQFPECKLSLRDGKTDPRIGHMECAGVMCGGYLMSYRQDTSDYVEEGMLPPRVLGAPWIDVWGHNMSKDGKRLGYIAMFQPMLPPLSNGAVV